MYRHDPLMRSLLSQFLTPTAPRRAVGFFRSGRLAGRPALLITQSTSDRLLCAPGFYLRRNRALFFRSYEGNLPSSFNTVLSSALAYSASPPVSVSGTDYTRELFPGTSSRPDQSNKVEQLTKSVTTRRPWNVDQVPIDYAFRPHLRGRLTLRRLT